MTSNLTTTELIADADAAAARDALADNDEEQNPEPTG